MGGVWYLLPGVVSQHTLRQTPPLWTEFLTHASENITLPQTSFAGGKYRSLFLIFPNSGLSLSDWTHFWRESECQYFYRPQTKFAKVMFLQVSVCPHRGGQRAWFYSAGGACMVLFGGHVWFYSGGVHGFIRGACVVLFGGRAWFYSEGACVVFSVFSDTMRYGQ